MSAKYYVDASGNYLGGFQGVPPPQGAIEVPVPPQHGRDRWDGSAWIPDPSWLAEKARLDADASEQQQAKIDAQIQSDLNMTPAEVNATVDTVFAGMSAAQRTFLKRLVRMVLAAARKVLR